MGAFIDYIESNKNRWDIIESPYNNVKTLYRFNNKGFLKDDLKTLFVESCQDGSYKVNINKTFSQRFLNEESLVGYLSNRIIKEDIISESDSLGISKKESRILKSVYSDNDIEALGLITLITSEKFNEEDFELYSEILIDFLKDYTHLRNFVKDLGKVIKRRSGQQIDLTLLTARVYLILAGVSISTELKDFRINALSFYKAYNSDEVSGFSIIANYVFDHVSVDSIDFTEYSDHLLLLYGRYSNSVSQIAQDLMISYYAFFDKEATGHDIDYYTDKVKTVFMWANILEGFEVYSDFLLEFADAPPSKVWKKEEIKEMLLTNDKAILRAIRVLYLLQTEDERSADSTKYHNLVGYNAIDAGFMSSLARQLDRKGTLTDKQITAARKILVKYSGQLTKVANKKIRVPESAIQEATMTDMADSKVMEYIAKPNILKMTHKKNGPVAVTVMGRGKLMVLTYEDHDGKFVSSMSDWRDAKQLHKFMAVYSKGNKWTVKDTSGISYTSKKNITDEEALAIVKSIFELVS